MSKREFVSGWKPGQVLQTNEHESDKVVQAIRAAAKQEAYREVRDELLSLPHYAEGDLIAVCDVEELFEDDGKFELKE